MANPLSQESVWLKRGQYEELEAKYLQAQSSSSSNENSKAGQQPEKSKLLDEIARARQHIKDSLQSGDAALSSSLLAKTLEEMLKPVVASLQKGLSSLEERVMSLEKQVSGLSIKPAKVEEPKKQAEAPKQNHVEKAADDDDDIDLFGSEEDEEADKVREERLKAYSEKKAKKPAPVAKSSVILDVKPWDDETDLAAMEKAVREISCDGLLWGVSQIQPIAYGINKLKITCVVEDEKVSMDWLQEQIEANEDMVQSVDICAFNKI